MEKDSVPMLFQAAVPNHKWRYFHGSKSFPMEYLQKADEEIEEFCNILTQEGIKVRRPEQQDFSVQYSTPDFKSTGWLYLTEYIIENNACMNRKLNVTWKYESYSAASPDEKDEKIKYMMHNWGANFSCPLIDIDSLSFRAMHANISLAMAFICAEIKKKPMHQ